MNAARAPAEALWPSLALPVEAVSRLQLTPQPDPAVDSTFKLGTAAQVCPSAFRGSQKIIGRIYMQTAIGLSGLAAAHFHQLRTGVEQTVTVDARHAVIEFSECIILEVNGSGSI